MTNLGEKDLFIEKGKAFAQGIFVEYGITVDDECDKVRKGGCGRTDKKYFLCLRDDSDGACGCCLCIGACGVVGGHDS